MKWRFALRHSTNSQAIGTAQLKLVSALLLYEVEKPRFIFLLHPALPRTPFFHSTVIWVWRDGEFSYCLFYARAFFINTDRFVSSVFGSEFSYATGRSGTLTEKRSFKARLPLRLAYRSAEIRHAFIKGLTVPPGEPESGCGNTAGWRLYSIAQLWPYRASCGGGSQTPPGLTPEEWRVG